MNQEARLRKRSHSRASPCSLISFNKNKRNSWNRSNCLVEPLSAFTALAQVAFSPVWPFLSLSSSWIPILHPATLFKEEVWYHRRSFLILGWSYPLLSSSSFSSERENTQSSLYFIRPYDFFFSLLPRSGVFLFGNCIPSRLSWKGRNG